MQQPISLCKLCVHSILNRGTYKAIVKQPWIIHYLYSNEASAFTCRWPVWVAPSLFQVPSPFLPSVPLPVAADDHRFSHYETTTKDLPASPMVSFYLWLFWLCSLLLLCITFFTRFAWSVAQSLPLTFPLSVRFMPLICRTPYKSAPSFSQLKRSEPIQPVSRCAPVRPISSCFATAIDNSAVHVALKVHFLPVDHSSLEIITWFYVFPFS